MAVSSGYLAYVLDQLSGVEDVSTRRMFGAVGVYAGGVFFAVIDDDVLYLKADDENRPAYVALGMQPFRPYADKPELSMSYYEVPPEALEDSSELQQWVRGSVAAATRGQAGRKPSRRKRPSKTRSY